ncbi:hypothetical protein DFA_02142 [Cavenderia fasciculata]|uniref:Uncharacterized protein n=1 Tax=Cavenderia fasciculata TaxID=261658 RepID=F4PYT9_CACFS|nr:uncharacterized protein DFA_02142 [Cavenderia fasciculata]EGG19355.1 hypothetical protein DFA_02142 [Cavenderia fasciculata]|eukprot:XP_004357626.1 hypothetical protein DFA_02142 [Cavenderia fasciculata]
MKTIVGEKDTDSNIRYNSIESANWLIRLYGREGDYNTTESICNSTLFVCEQTTNQEYHITQVIALNWLL